MKTILHYSFFLIMFFLLSCEESQDQHDTFAKKSTKKDTPIEIYFKHQKNEKKIKAAKYFMSHMKYHFSDRRVISIPDSLKKWQQATDKIYYSLCKRYGTFDNIPKNKYDSCKCIINKTISPLGIARPSVEEKTLCDFDELNSQFIIEHINHSFKMWEHSQFARNLSFEEFVEYLLPYRSVNNYGFLETGKTYHDIFAKYILLDSPKDIVSAVKNYNNTINGLRDLNGKIGRKGLLSYYDLFSRDNHDCVDIANYCANILRACGIPTALDYNISYRDFVGRHYFCAVMDDSTHTWKPFNPESSLPGEEWDTSEDLNIYRHTFAAQVNTPYFLRRKEEFIPSVLSSPCIKDVTSMYKQVYKVCIDIDTNSTSRLVYLTTFNKATGGTIAVTWSIIQRGKAVFDNVVPNVLYFPMRYSEKGEEIYCAEPFFLSKDGKTLKLSDFYKKEKKSNVHKNIVLTRKYPHKTSMQKKAKELVGGRFIGSNDKDFKSFNVLYEITEPPKPEVTRFPFTKTGKYKYYRYLSPSSSPHANISILEWNYDNRSITLSKGRDWDNEKWRAEYDGNMQTAPCAYPTIDLELDQAEVIRGVSLAPINADNSIHIGHKYELRYWHKGWKSAGKVIASSNFLTFNNIPSRTLYWLIDHTEGKEESPFLIKNNKQIFLYTH